ncbi:hypothetical protein LAUMK13_05628 [Mycobacterium innocens]|uniref:Uncharacterized protein n=1 Tax=Mycobacterium innocens TaxID=2341083 RepID=A0A498QKW8_9MYCO|nr:hypothetical protein LAUMK13_05628 [Mycobacterium innocens]
MHVARTSSNYVDKSGNVRRYESVLVRRTFRHDGKVRHETLANLSKLPEEAVTAIEAALKGQALVAAGSELRFVKWFGPTDLHEFWPRAFGVGA